MWQRRLSRFAATPARSAPSTLVMERLLQTGGADCGRDGSRPRRGKREPSGVNPSDDRCHDFTEVLFCTVVACVGTARHNGRPEGGVRWRRC